MGLVVGVVVGRVVDLVVGQQAVHVGLLRELEAGQRPEPSPVLLSSGHTDPSFVLLL